VNPFPSIHHNHHNYRRRRRHRYDDDDDHHQRQQYSLYPPREGQLSCSLSWSCRPQNAQERRQAACDPYRCSFSTVDDDNDDEQGA